MTCKRINIKYPGMCTLLNVTEIFNIYYNQCKMRIYNSNNTWSALICVSNIVIVFFQQYIRAFVCCP